MQISVTGIEHKHLIDVLMLRMEQIMDLRERAKPAVGRTGPFPSIQQRMDAEELVLRDVMAKLRKARERAMAR